MTPLPTPQQLRYLIALDEQGHFGRAAAACAVTQSTLSAGMLALERQLNVSLLDRDTGKRPVFTPVGRDIVARARIALSALQAITEAAVASGTVMSGPIRIGVIPTIGPFLLPELMPALRAAFPQLRIFLREDTTERLIDRLNTSRLDVALLALPCTCSSVETLPFGRDSFLAVLPPDHPLAALDEVPAGALMQERLLLLEDGHCLRNQVLDACGVARGDRGQEEGFVATSLHTLVQMVAGGLGVTLLPQLAIAHGILRGTGLVTRPLTGAGTWRTLVLGWRRNTGRAEDWQRLAPILSTALTSKDGYGPGLEIIRAS